MQLSLKDRIIIKGFLVFIALDTALDPHYLRLARRAYVRTLHSMPYRSHNHDSLGD